MRRSDLWVQMKRYPLMILVTLLLLGLILLPIVRLMITSFLIGHPAMPDGWSFDTYRHALSLPLFYQALRTTLFLATVGTVITLSVAILFAWLIERTDMPCRNLAWVLLLIPLAIPGILTALSWGLLLGPRAGSINLLLRSFLEPLGLHLTTGPINIYSMGGLVFLDGLTGVSTAFLMIVGAFRMMDPALEEAARVSKAGSTATLFKVVLPLLMPAILLAAIYRFVLIMESFDIPLAIGLPAKIYVLSTLIYYMSRILYPINYSASCVFGLVLMFLMILLIAAYRYFLRYFQHYTTVTGKGYRPRVISLGKGRYPALAIFVIYFLLMVLAPLLILFWGSLMPSYRPPSLEALRLASLSNYIEIFSRSDFWRTISNTFQVTLVTATATMIISLIVSWIVIRTKMHGRGILDTFVFLPHAIPGIVLGLAFIMAFLTFPLNQLGIYGTIWIIVLALVTQYVAFGTRVMNGAILQIHKELEEAAYVSKASPFKTVLEITLPLLFPAFASAWIWSVVTSMRAFAIPLMLASRKSQVISVMLWGYWDDGYVSMAATLGVLLILVLIPVTLILRRYIVQVSGQGA
jgi:iron(III) transport system permease protein